METSRPSPSARPTLDDDHADAHVGWTLLGGLALSIAIMALGLILVAFDGATGTGHVLPLDQLLPQLDRGKPSAVLDLGILLLFATPLVGVMVALAEFVRRRDVPFVLITGLLLVALAGGFVVALR